MLESDEKLISRDSIYLSMLYRQNIQLTNAIAKILTRLKFKSKLWDQKNLADFMGDLEACENRIVIAGLIYNNRCKATNSMDILWGETADHVRK